MKILAYTHSALFYNVSKLTCLELDYSLVTSFQKESLDIYLRNQDINLVLIDCDTFRPENFNILEYIQSISKKTYCLVVETTIHEIDKDALNITPYLNFLKSYRLSEIERAMKLLYRYNTIGKDDAYLQFNRMIQTTTKWLRSEREQHHQDSLAIYEWFSMIPLLGVTLLFLAIMCDVILNMFTNGI